MRKYRITGNTSGHAFENGQIVMKCGIKLALELCHEYSTSLRTFFFRDWMTSDGTEKNSWRVNKEDVEVLKKGKTDEHPA